MKNSYFILIAVLIIGVALIVSSDSLDPVNLENDVQNFQDILEEDDDIELTSKTIVIDGEEKTLRIPSGFDITISAEGLGKARLMTISPDGRMFVPDQVDYALSHEGSIYILDNFNEETHEFENITTYLTDLRGPNDVKFYTDEDGQSWIYITLTQHLIRYPYQAGDNSPSGEAEVVYEFPNEISPNAQRTVWHLTRTINFKDGDLYVSVGSGCNACEELEEDLRAMILKMTPEGEDVEIYAEGIKNAVGMIWVEDELYATENGADHLGEDAPDDLMFRVSQGEHYGWPYCYESNGQKIQDDAQEWENQSISCDDVPMSFTAFDPHSAPISLEYFGDNSHLALRNHFLVALQGSFRPEIANGYQIIRVSEDGQQDVFLDGFYEDEEGEGFGKPVDVLQKDENSFFFTDDLGGRVYYVYSN